MEERNYWLGFSVFSGVGPLKFKKLLAEFGTAEKAWKAEITDLKKVLGDKLTIKFDKFRNEFSIKDYLEKLKKKNAWFITSNDTSYPELLLEIPNPPFVLFGRGLRFEKFKDELKQTIGIVGSRKPTNYGKEVTQKFAEDLSLSGFTIVSGLALGIDGISHLSTLENGGKTIAVLGCGVDCCTPIHNKNIYDKIINGRGCVISEVPLSYLPGKGLFPSRNRIIAGLSKAVLVTEGAEDSGSLITADFAFKFNRKVFAVPGPINSVLSKGPYKLINKGAKLVTSTEDILNELKLQIPNYKSQINPKTQTTKYKTESKEERLILQALRNEELYFDEIARKTRIDSSKLGSILSMMEIKGIVKNVGNSTYSVKE
ncbi:MAG: DNA-protecting protein DprA [Candidatus Levybacteria bacterium]|nr:DNA-protecting protein DprA [Candidatus Levybacteria bacterium]